MVGPHHAHEGREPRFFHNKRSLRPRNAGSKIKLSFCTAAAELREMPASNCAANFKTAVGAAQHELPLRREQRLGARANQSAKHK